MSRSARLLNSGLLVLAALFFVTAPWSIPMVASPFWVLIVTELLIWSLLAASVNLLFGYVGLLSFGQALYFGFGMYGVAIGIETFGLGFWPAFGLGIVASVGMALVAGIFAVRLTWHYFAIITVVFSLIFYFVALSSKPITGGDDGIGFSMPPMFVFGETEISLTDPNTQYFFILAVVALCYLLMWRVLESPLGRAWVAIRENDSRAELIGLNVYALRLMAFVAAGFVAGVGGALFALFGRYASASYMFYHVSGEAVVWALVGGIGTLFGPILGAGILIVLREELSTFWDHYLLLVGVIVILMVIFAPKGVVGFYRDVLARLGGRGGDE